MMVNKVCLLLLISTTLLAQDLLQLRLIGQPEKSTGEFVGSAITDANGRICAAVQVVSDMDGFSYQANNDVVRLDDGPGKDMVFLQPDEMVLEILHSGYQPLKLVLNEIGIHLSSREVWMVKIGGDRSRLAIVIMSEPEAAEVFIDNVSFGNGKQHSVATGTHQLRLIKAGYQTLEQTIQVDEQHVLFNFTLKKVQDVALLIDSEPVGAVLYLDGVKLGTAPFAGFYPPGQYRLKAVMDWYQPFEEEIELAGPRTQRTVRLQENFGRLTVNSSPQKELDIYLNGLPQQSRTPFTFERMALGTYRVQARSALYETNEETVTLTAGEGRTVNLTSRPGFATLTVHTVPGATVYLDGKKLEQLQNLRVEPSLIVLRAELAKAPAVEERVTLRKGESRTVELVPIVPTGTIQVAVTPFEAKMELRGDAGEYFTATGAAIFNDVPIGVYNLTITLEGYLEKKETLELKQGDKVNSSIKLEKMVENPPDSKADQPAAAKSNWRDPKTGIEFVLIKGGTFQMGDLFDEGESDEKPVHTVAVSDFYLAKTEVTVAQHRAFCQATRRSMPEAPDWGWIEDHPMVNVSWQDARAYCDWGGCRLPTEAEWEYAARERGRKVRFGNGKDIADPADINFNGSAEFKMNYSRMGINRGKTTAVASFAANSLDLYDMSGNVWEWCLDWYGKDYYGQSLEVNSQEPSSERYRVLRGGSWLSYLNNCRASDRYRDYPSGFGNNIGFRVARSAQ